MTYRILDGATFDDYSRALRKAHQVETLLDIAFQLIHEIDYTTVTDTPDIEDIQHQMAFTTDSIKDAIASYERTYNLVA